jgi:hypothetical protein
VIPLNPQQRQDLAVKVSKLHAAKLTTVGMHVTVRLDDHSTVAGTLQRGPWELGHGVWVADVATEQRLLRAYDCGRITPGGWECLVSGHAAASPIERTESPNFAPLRKYVASAVEAQSGKLVSVAILVEASNIEDAIQEAGRHAAMLCGQLVRVTSIIERPEVSDTGPIATVFRQLTGGPHAR